MLLLWKVIVASACRSTHHKLVMDSLRHLRGPHADLWQGLLLKHYESYLDGSKAPDDQFKDFKNHVLHVGDNGWGGAITAAQLWRERTLLAMRKQYWPDVAFSLGVLSHYFTDPHMPFHTGQTEEEGKVHRAAEWSIACGYDELQSILENDLGGYPDVPVPSGADWLATMIKRGAGLAHAQYYPLIDHYDLKKGVKDPRTGFDQTGKDIIAALLGEAAVGFARVLEKVATEANAKPPLVELSLETFLATTKMPSRWITKNLANEADRRQVEAIYDEVRRTGKVVENLPADDKQVRRMYAEQVLKVPVAQLDAAPARPAGTKYGQGAKPREHRDPRPLIGPASARAKSKPAKIANPLLNPPASTKPFSSRPATVRFTPRPLTSVPVRATTVRPPVAEVDRPPAPLSAARLTNDEELPLAQTIEDDGEPAATTPAAPTPTNRWRWLKRPNLSGLKDRIVNSRVGRMIEKAKSLPKKLRLRPLSVNKPVEPARDEADSDAESAIPVNTERKRRVTLNVANDLEPPPPTKPVREPERRSSDGGDLRFYLEEEQPLEAAPSIGPKMAKRFAAIGIHTVADFLATSPDKIATQLDHRAIDAAMIKQWQAQTTLACRVPQIRGHDAQILVGCGVTEPDELASMDERDLLELVTPFVTTAEGQRILRNSAPPDLDEIRDWIRWARHARPLRAA